MKEVILMGKGTLAIKIAKWFNENPNYNLKLIVPVIPEPVWTDSLIEWSKQNNIEYMKSGNYQDILEVNNDNWEIDLVFSVFYDKIIKDFFIKKCNKILNLHNALLPKYRGVNPINWALKNNEPIHGITIHEISPGIDDGRIISQISYSIYPDFDEVQDVYNRALTYGWTLFEQTMPILDKIIPKIQDESQSTYYSLNDSTKLGNRTNFTKGKSK
mgnify:CR=1 FL=1|tara:strand:+ start:485 stop:1129 length:645 start_codon:yes stop_codon:yes gene_type:complete